MITSHVTPYQHLTLLLRRHTRKYLLNRRCLRREQSIVLWSPGRYVRKQISIQLSITLWSLVWRTIIRRTVRIVSRRCERRRSGKCLADGSSKLFCLAARIALLVTEKIIDCSNLVEMSVPSSRGDILREAYRGALRSGRKLLLPLARSARSVRWRCNGLWYVGQHTDAPYLLSAFRLFAVISVSARSWKWQWRQIRVACSSLAVSLRGFQHHCRSHLFPHRIQYQ